MGVTGASQPQRLPARVMLFNLLTLCVIAAAIAVAAAYGIDALRQAQRAAALPPDISIRADKTVAGQSLSPPVSWLRDPAEQGDGFAERLDLVVPVRFASTGAEAQLDVTLLSVTRARISAYLLDTVYLQRFLPEQLNGPVGLVGKPLKDGDGYDGDVVWYDALSLNPFVALCSPPVGDGMPLRCVRTIALEGTLAAIVSFDASLLRNWREMDAALEGPLALIGTGFRR